MLSHNNKDLAALVRAAAHPILDAAADQEGDAGPHVQTEIRLLTAGTIQQWVETEEADLADGETLADRLLALAIGVCDADINGELSDDEQAVLDQVLNGMWDYFAAKGASDDDCDLLINEQDAAASMRVRDLVVAKLPSDPAECHDDIDSFAFGDGANDAVFDAAFKAAMVVRGGKKMRIKKRISGHVHLSAAQKVALRKARSKSHSATAMMHRAKSNRVRARAGM